MFQVCGSDFSWYLYECIWLRVFLFFSGLSFHVCFSKYRFAFAKCVNRLFIYRVFSLSFGYPLHVVHVRSIQEVKATVIWWERIGLEDGVRFHV